MSDEELIIGIGVGVIVFSLMAYIRNLRKQLKKAREEAENLQNFRAKNYQRHRAPTPEDYKRQWRYDRIS